jgi:hypothetical protein
MWPSDGFNATAPTLNFNVTQQSLALGVLGTPRSHDRRAGVNFGMHRAPSKRLSVSLVTFTFCTVSSVNSPCPC